MKCSHCGGATNPHVGWDNGPVEGLERCANCGCSFLDGELRIAKCAQAAPQPAQAAEEPEPAPVSEFDVEEQPKPRTRRGRRK